MKDCGRIHLIGAKMFHIELCCSLKAERPGKGLRSGFAKGFGVYRTVFVERDRTWHPLGSICKSRKATRLLPLLILSDNKTNCSPSRSPLEYTLKLYIRKSDFFSPSKYFPC
jgi:hypothetical protein